MREPVVCRSQWADAWRNCSDARSRTSPADCRWLISLSNTCLMIRCKAPRVNPRWVPPRIEHPDLPVELQSATGELAAALWMRAVDLAQDQLAAAQLEAQRSVVNAQARQAQAEAERDQLCQELTGSAAALDGARTRINELEQALAISVAAA